MNKKNLFSSLLDIDYKRFPIRKKIIVFFSFFSVLALIIINLISSISVVFISGPRVILRDFFSNDKSYQLQIPKGWGYDENINGIHGDTNIIFMGIEGSLFQPYFDISRINVKNVDADLGLAWGQDIALHQQNVEINSTSSYNTILYNGKLLIYTVQKAGYENRLTECHAWFSYTEPYSYMLRLCSIPKDWGRLEKPFQQIIASFKINNK